MKIVFLVQLISLLLSQSWFNHPELKWKTLESEHFLVHYHNGSKRTAEEALKVAEFVYTPITDMYKYRPKQKTSIVIKDTDDFSNGSAYFFDNKIEIWANPLDFDLRGSHRWIQNVITHEFVHIVQLGASLKYNRHFPAFYFQMMDYEQEVRTDVLNGYPNTIISYSIPSVSVPPWFAEGVAQFMYNGANFDYWDTHRDMVLRDAFLNKSVYTIDQMSSFGKSGIGNEQVYIQGFSLASYMAIMFGEDVFRKISDEISKPYQYSFAGAVFKATGKKIDYIYNNWYNDNLEKYKMENIFITKNKKKGKVLVDEGIANLHPVWSPDESKFAYLSNKNKDYFGQTDLYVYNFSDSLSEKIISGVFSAPVWLDDSTLIFSKKSKPNKYGSKYYDLYAYKIDQEKKEPKRLTYGLRLTSPSIDREHDLLAAVGIKDGTSNIYMTSILSNVLDELDSLKFDKMTSFEKGEKIFSLSFNNKKILFDLVKEHTRDIYMYDIESNRYSYIEDEIWDARDPFYHNGNILFSSDKSGVFNLYIRKNGRSHCLSNLIGGGFMPSVSKTGKVLFSSYDKGGYNISIITDMSTISISPDYSDYTRKSSTNISIPDYDSYDYDEEMSLPFVFPRLFLDYGKIKPGFYFYSNDVLNKYFLFGGASMNEDSDLDLFLLFETKRFRSTLYANFYWVTRNLNREVNYTSIDGDTYHNMTMKSKDKYRMFSSDIGSRIAFKANKFTFNYNYSKYTAHAIGYTRLDHQGTLLESTPFDITYDYYRGHKLTLGYQLKAYSPQYIFNMLPQNGFEVNADVSFEKNDFDPKFEISKDYGTLSLIFSNHNTTRFNFELKKNFTLIKKKRVAYNQSLKLGYLTNQSIDDFFYYFGGGLTGVKGYTFYEESLSGTQLLISSSILRFPIFLEKNYKVLHLLIQNLSLNYIAQIGAVSFDEPKYSNGIEIRVNGSSFYSFPFALSYECHRPINGDKENNGIYDKHYIKLLFEFMD